MDEETIKAFEAVDARLDTMNMRIDRVVEALDASMEGAVCEPAHEVSEDFLWDLIHERNYRQLLARKKVAVEEFGRMGVWLYPSGPGSQEVYGEEEDGEGE